MGTHVETFPARGTSMRTWAIVGVVVLLFAALGGGVLIGRATVEEPAPPQGLASAEVVKAIDADIASLNAGDPAGFAAAYAKDAVVTNMISDIETKGADEIAAVYMDGPVGGWQMERTSEVVQIGDLAANALTYNGGAAISVFKFDDNMKIVHQWAVGV